MSLPGNPPAAVDDGAELLRLSKEVSRVLRHRPDSAGVLLDRHGWVSIGALLAGLAARGVHMSRAKLDEIVSTSDKQRFAISDDGQSIRANQGHSVGGVNLQLRPKFPPSRLFHGTSAVNVESIERSGLRPMKRNHVHLSPDRATAIAVGGRRGAAVVFEIDAHRMHTDGIKFLQSVNGVWLVDSVASKYLTKCS
ncbi:RNA 2'-phosphotransferase [Rhizobacter fulvus]